MALLLREEYHGEQYQLKVSDPRQPLLISRTKKNDDVIPKRGTSFLEIQGRTGEEHASYEERGPLIGMHTLVKEQYHGMYRSFPSTSQVGLSKHTLRWHAWIRPSSSLCFVTHKAVDLSG